MPTVADLGKAVKRKYPGVYEDLIDAEVGRRVKQKFPQDYGDYTEIGTVGEGEPPQLLQPMAGQPPVPTLPFVPQPAGTFETPATGVGQIIGERVAGPVGGAVGGMTAKALMRRATTGEWPTWRELGLEGAITMVVPMVKGLAQGGQELLRLSRPGQQFMRTKALQEFDRLTERTEQNIAGLEERTGMEVGQLERMGARVRRAREEYVTHAQQDLQRELTLSRAKLEGLRQQGVETARDFVKKLPVLTDDEMAALRQKVGDFRFTMPTDLLRDAQHEIAKDVGTVQKFFPAATLGERARLAQAPGVAAPTPSVSPIVDRFGQPIVHPPPPPVTEQMSFQEAHEVLKWLGQRIGSLQRATTPDAGEQLGAAKFLYSRIWRMLDTAAESATTPAQARDALKAWNFAYKQRATVETLGDTVEAAIGTNSKGQLVLNPGKMLDALRKGKEGTFLADRLREVGMFDEVDTLFKNLTTAIRDEAQRIPALRQRFAGQALEIVPSLREQESAFLAAAQATRTRTAAEIDEIKRDLTTLQASLPAPVQGHTTPTIGAVATLGGVGGYLLGGGQYGALVAAPWAISRLLMTETGQKLVAKTLQANAGVLDDASLRVLVSAALRDVEALGVPGLPTQPTRQLRQSRQPGRGQ